MKKYIYTIAALAVAGMLSACTEEIVIDKVNEDAYNNVTNLVASLRDANTLKTSNIVELRTEDYNTSVLISLPRKAQKGLDINVAVEPSYVAEYNRIHRTSFAAYPAENATIQNNGKIVVAPDDLKSYSLNLSLKAFDDTEEATYVLPLKAEIKQDGVTISEERLIYLVKNLKGQASALRNPGEKSVFCYFEVNDTNPLNVLCFEMEDGRLLIDYLVLFAYNINYDKEKGEVYCFANPQCQYILDHYDEVIKPLRDRGVKVLIGLLGNHDESGLAQLSEIGARDFASKMAAICYGYGFDGINFDDEYSNSPDLNCPLFAPKSKAAGDRLIFECKKAMPDLLMTSYQVGSCSGSSPVDGVLPGEYLDITVADYGGTASCYQGMSLSQCSYMSSEFALKIELPTVETAAKCAASDYGFWMIFGLWSGSSQGTQSRFPAMQALAKGLYGLDLKKPTYYYPETKSLETKPITW